MKNELLLAAQKTGIVMLVFVGGHMFIKRHHEKNQQQVLNNTLFEAIFESIHTPAFSLDNNYRYLVFNKAHADMMRSIYSCEISLGKCVLDYIPVEKDRLQAKKNLTKTLHGERLITSESYGLPDRRRYLEIDHNPIKNNSDEIIGISVFAQDITKRIEMEEERSILINNLQNAIENIKVLQGLLPICSVCKKVRDDEGYWHEVEVYVRDRTEANFSHSFCPDCCNKILEEIKPKKSMGT